MAFEALAFGVAALLHLAGHLPLAQWDPDAGIAEAIIAVVLAVGSGAVLTARPRARRTALWTVGFAIFGVLVGLWVTVGSIGPRGVPNLAFHAAVLALLLYNLARLLRPRTR